MCMMANRWYLQGVVSGGKLPCGSPNSYPVYTNIASYKEWVVDTLSNVDS